MSSVRLLLRAKADLEEAVGWHKNSSLRAARRFDAAVASTIERIVTMPEAYALVDDLHRICPVRRSQYLIIYRYESTADEVVIVAVGHARQNLRGWLRKT